MSVFVSSRSSESHKHTNVMSDRQYVSRSRRASFIRHILAVILPAIQVACGSDTPASPSPPALQSSTGAIEGIVNHQSYVQNRLAVPEGPLGGAQVVVTEGPGAGRTFTTGSDGAYRFDVPPGPFRVRWSANGYESRESDVGTVTAGATARLQTITLRLSSNLPIAEWSISGVVVDGRGDPVAGAFVSVFSDVLTVLAGGQTDGQGRFRATSTQQHPDPVGVVVEKPGYTRAQTPVACGANCAANVTVRLLRIIREWLDVPSSMQVGDITPVTAVTEFDDGSRAVSTPYSLRSSNSSVVQVQPSLSESRVYVKAVAAGTVTLTTGELMQSIRVYP